MSITAGSTVLFLLTVATSYSTSMDDADVLISGNSLQVENRQKKKRKYVELMLAKDILQNHF